MDEKPKSRKKGVYLLLLAFLLAGGGIFLFFIIQGANDLAGPKNSNFQYGTIARNSMMPFFKYIGIVSDDAEALSKSAAERLKSRGVVTGEGKLAAADISDWMGKPSAGLAPSGSGSGSDSGYGGSSHHGSASASAPSVVPRMGAKAGGLPEGGGGGSQSSGGRFSASGDKGNTRITNGLASASGSGADKGTLGSLRGAQAMLTAATRSGSAMTAKSNWDSSFGAGGGGKSVGNMAYGKSGLVGLDHIKSGEITNLKTTDEKSLKVNPPVQDPSMKSTDPLAESKDKDTSRSAAMATAASNTPTTPTSTTGTTDPATKSAGGSGPPTGVKNLAEKQSPDGPYCPNSCSLDSGAKYKDNPPTYAPSGSNWQVTYTGTQTSPNGTTIYYQDSCVVDPSTNKITDVTSFEGPSADNLTKVPSVPS